MATHSSSDPRLHYSADRELIERELGARFVQLACDDAARTFITRARARPHGRVKSALFGALRQLMSDYDAYGLLGMYPMHLVSTAQARALLREHARGRLLDVGAGEGGVTAQLAPLFSQVTATEQAPPLARRLARRGFAVVEHDLGRAPWPREERFDVVSCLNVVDRTAYPRSLLSHAAQLLADDDRLLFSVPLPLRPLVYAGPHTVGPDEPLPPAVQGFERGAIALARELLEPCGLSPCVLSRLPYLSRGDRRSPLYVLDAAVFVCRASR